VRSSESIWTTLSCRLFGLPVKMVKHNAHRSTAHTELPLYLQPIWRNHYNFSALDEFAKEQRINLGSPSPHDSFGLDELRRRLQQKQKSTILADPTLGNATPNSDTERQDNSPRQDGQQNINRGQQKSKVRFEKLALFESTPGSILFSHSFTYNPKVAPLTQNFDIDDSVRFFFYSRSLSSPVHVQNICDLVAEEQSYE
jgi:hypothetical protein